MEVFNKWTPPGCEDPGKHCESNRAVEILTLPTIPGLKDLVHLGSGAAGDVFRARQQDGHECAVKVLSGTKALSRLERVRFQREFEVLSQIDHPNILKVYQYFPDVPCFTMELVRGQCLDGWLSGQRNLFAEPEFGRFVACIRHVLVALSELHAQGIVHRDLKPANLMVDEHHTLKVMDFGLAHVTADERITRSGAILGTPLYLAPEQLSGQAADDRSDLYSLGMVLYEACGGEMPASARGLMAFLQGLLSWQPRDLRQSNPRVPNWLSQFIEKLMARNSTDRFRSAKEALQALAGDDREVCGPVGLDQPQFLEAGFVGREAELATMVQVWDRLNQGGFPKGVTVALGGEAGVGKTRFWEESKRLALARGLTVHQVACLEGEPTPYAPFLPLLRLAIQQLQRAGHTLESKFGSLASSLTRVLPELEGQLPAGQRLEEAVEKARFFEVVSRLLSELSPATRGVLCFDDVQWSDPASLELLSYTRRHSPWATVLLYRSDEVPADHLVHRVLDQAERLQKVERITLAALSAGHLEAMVLSILGGSSVHRDLSVYLADASVGNPLYLSELLRALHMNGELQRDQHEWILTRAGDAAEPASSMALLVERRLTNLPELARDLTGAAAVLGKRFRYAVLRKMFDSRPEEDVFIALEELLKARLLAEVPAEGRDVLAFYHDRYREVVLARLSGIRFQRLHKQAAHAYENSSVELVPPPDVLARHYLEAGDVDSARQHLRKAALQARNSYASQRALGYYLQIRELGETSDDLQETIADLQSEVGEAVKGIETYSQLLTKTHEPERRCSLLKKRSLALRNLGRHSEALEGHLEALEILGVKVSRSLVGAMIWAILRFPNLRWLLRPPIPNRELTAESSCEEQELYDTALQTGMAWVDDPVRLAIVSNLLSRQFELAMQSRHPVKMGYAFVMASCAITWQMGGVKWGMDLGVALAERALATVKGISQPRSLARTYRYAGYAFMQVGQVDRSIELIRKSGEMSQEVNDFYGLLESKVYLTIAHYYPGRFAAMLELGQEGVQLASLGADRYFEATSALLVAIAKVSQGETGQAQEEFASIAKLVRQIDNALLDYFAGACRGLILLSEAHWSQAEEEFRKVQPNAPGAFFQSEVAFHRGDALLRAGDTAGVKKILRHWARKVGHLPRQQARWLHLQALVHYQEGRIGPAHREIHRSIEAAQLAGARAHIGKSQMVAGRIDNDQELYATGRAVLTECQDLLSIAVVGDQ